ncbi:hypothetical protein [Nitrincola sp. A-D6]|uniref:hypothetical protein n=1 Tax=Nitrincola sp. A-D6 TaxID=1545442 RepID=UPI00068BC46C|nr:hypothetical protein [Nitrincola sp. A-D6]
MSQRQEVNLYQSDLHEKREQLTARHMLVIIAVALLLMLLYSGWTAYSLNSLKQDNQQLTAQLNQQRQTVTELASMTRPEADPRLLQHTRRLENEIRHLRALRETALIPLDAADPEQFLRGLARQRPDGLWLTGIHLAGLGQDILLQGRVMNAELLPIYIDLLGIEPAFTGLVFHTLEINQPGSDVGEDDSAALTFRLVAGCKTQGCSLDNGGSTP